MPTMIATFLRSLEGELKYPQYSVIRDWMENAPYEEAVIVHRELVKVKQAYLQQQMLKKLAGVDDDEEGDINAKAIGTAIARSMTQAKTNIAVGVMAGASGFGQAQTKTEGTSTSITADIKQQQMLSDWWAEQQKLQAANTLTNHGYNVTNNTSGFL